MKSILVIGAGFSAKVLIDYLSKQAKEKIGILLLLSKI